MDLPRFQQLVQTFEVRAAAYPVRSRWEVGFLATLGYLYLVVVTLVLLAAVGLAALAAVGAGSWILLFYTVPPFLALGAIARSVAFSYPRPTGIEVPLSQTPALAQVIEEIRMRCDGPQVHRLLVTTELNASVLPYPRLGIFGWYENHLILGIQLLAVFPTSEFVSILAHEFGHLAGRHGRMGAWIHRQRTMYARLEDSMAKQQGRLSTWIFAPLRRWYFPYFNARAFALARQQEYDADEFAATFAGADVATRALARLHVIDRWRQVKRGPELDRRAQAGEPLPERVYEEYEVRLSAQITPEEVHSWLLEDLRVPTDHADSHPSFNDRLAALHPSRAAVAPEVPWNLGAEKGIALLGHRGPDILAMAGDAWRAAAGEGWRLRHQRSVELRIRLRELDDQEQTAPLSPTERWERVVLAEEVDGFAATADRARPLADADPTLYGARFVVARDLLRTDPTGAIVEFEAIAAASPPTLIPVADLMFGYFWAQGDRAAAERWRLRSIARHEALAAAEVERSRYEKSMVCAPHGLPAETVERIREAVAHHPEVQSAFLIRRVVTHLSDEPCYILGIVPRIPWWKPVRLPSVKELMMRIVRSTEYPGDTHAIPLVLDLKPLRKKFRRIPGALLIGK